MSWRMRLALDVALAILGVVVAVGFLVLVVDGVERGSVWAEQGAGTWLMQLLALAPARIVAGLPVAAGIAGVAVGVWWRRTHRWLALQSVGIAPSRLVGPAVLGAVGALAIVAGTRELAAPWSALRAPQDGWVAASVGGAPVVVAARQVDGTRAEGVRVARLDEDGQVSALYGVERADWTGAGWSEPGLPPPEEWARARAGLGPRVPAAWLWQGARTPARSAWLAERLASPWLALGLAVLGVLAGARDRLTGLVWVGVALALALLHGGGFQQAARGVWPVAATGLPAVVASLGVLGAWLGPSDRAG